MHKYLKIYNLFEFLLLNSQQSRFYDRLKLFISIFVADREAEGFVGFLTTFFETLPKGNNIIKFPCAIAVIFKHLSLISTSSIRFFYCKV